MYGAYRRLGDGFKRLSKSYYPAHLGSVGKEDVVFQGNVGQLDHFIWSEIAQSLKIIKKEGEPWLKIPDCLAAAH